MTDTLSDLRAVANVNGDTYSSAEVIAMVRRAADEIERLKAWQRTRLEDDDAQRADRERLKAALAFYADPVRYQGSNQRNDSNDPWSNGAPYIKDVIRDCGGIARNAIGATEQV